MAGERKVDQGTANEVLSESLGLSMDDLGVNSLEDMNIEGDDLPDGELDGDDEPSDDDISVGPSGNPADDLIDDGLSVSHTNRQQPTKPGQQPPKPQKQWNPAQFQTTRDRKGNLLGPDGKIVAFAGREARLYLGHQQLRNEFHTLQTSSTSMRNDLVGRITKAVEIGQQAIARVQELQNAPNVVKEYGLNDDQAKEALSLAKQSLTDPVGAVKTLLTRAAARGIDLTTLGLQPGGFDPNSLMQLVREEIAKVTQPVVERNQRETAAQTQQRESEQAASAVREELNTFLGQNPAAKNYLHIFNNVYASGNPQLTKMSLGEIWAKLQLNLMKKGIDPNKPPPQDQRSQNRNGNQRPSPRLPNGRGNPPGGFGGERQQADPNALAPVESRYEDIVKDVLKGIA